MTPELKTACEVIFQEHKVSAQPIKWSAETFRGRISLGLSDLAKDTLVKKNIIILPNKSKKILTQLNPDVAAAKSFEEAEDIIKNKKQVLNGYSADNNGSHVATQTSNKYVSDNNVNQTTKEGPNRHLTDNKAKQDSNGQLTESKGSYAPYRVSSPVIAQPQPRSRQVSLADATEIPVAGLKWYMRPLFYYVVWPLFALMAGALISYFIDFAYTELFLTHK